MSRTAGTRRCARTSLRTSRPPQVAERFGYAPSTVVAMVRDFTADPGEFFVERRPGPTLAPSKLAARDEVLRLRSAGHSVTEIAQALAAGATPLNRTGVWELLAAEGHERLAPRAPGERGAPARDNPPRVRMLRWPEQSLTLSSDHAGVMLLLPALVALDLPGAVERARFPGTARFQRCHRCCRCWRSKRSGIAASATSMTSAPTLRSPRSLAWSRYRRPARWGATATGSRARTIRSCWPVWRGR